MKNITLAAILIVYIISGCTSPTSFLYFESQSATIDSYREMGFFEYASPLNSEMWAVLKNEQLNLVEAPTFKTIKKLNNKILKEKMGMGCYVMGWEKKGEKIYTDDIIMLEWNESAGVIIRFFTKNPINISKLPKNSF